MSPDAESRRWLPGFDNCSPDNSFDVADGEAQRIKLALELSKRDTGRTLYILDVIKTADWLIDMGPEGGDGGGRVVAVGTPEDVAQNEESHTGRYLKRLLSTQSL